MSRFLAAAALAQSDVDGDCPPTLEAYLPDAYDRHVPTDVAPVVILGTACPTLPTAGLVVDATGDPVPAEVRQESATILRIVPDQPLVPVTTYRITWNEGRFESRFTVGDAVAAAPAEPAVAVSFDHLCSRATVFSFAVVATFPEPDPTRDGLVWLVPSVDGVEGAPMGPALYTGQDVVELEGDVLGGRQACVSLAFDDLAGERAWRSEEVCDEVVVCEDEPEGCGCDPVGSHGPLGVLAGLPWLIRRRR